MDASTAFRPTSDDPSVACDDSPALSLRKGLQGGQVLVTAGHGCNSPSPGTITGSTWACPRFPVGLRYGNNGPPRPDNSHSGPNGRARGPGSCHSGPDGRPLWPSRLSRLHEVSEASCVAHFCQAASSSSSFCAFFTE